MAGRDGVSTVIISGVSPMSCVQILVLRTEQENVTNLRQCMEEIFVLVMMMIIQIVMVVYVVQVNFY